MSIIRWTGKSTNGVWKRKEKANSFIDLYNLCVENETISTYDNDPYISAVLEKFGKSGNDFLDEDGEIDVEAIDNWYNESGHDLSDSEIMMLISTQNGNAYYQTFERFDEELGEYVEITLKDFDENGEYVR